MSRLPYPAIVSALAALAIASALVSWGSWTLFLRARTPSGRGRHRGRHRRRRLRLSGREPRRP